MRPLKFLLILALVIGDSGAAPAAAAAAAASIEDCSSDAFDVAARYKKDVGGGPECDPAEKTDECKKFDKDAKKRCVAVFTVVGGFTSAKDLQSQIAANKAMANPETRPAITVETLKTWNVSPAEVAQIDDSVKEYNKFTRLPADQQKSLLAQNTVGGAAGAQRFNDAAQRSGLAQAQAGSRAHGVLATAGNLGSTAELSAESSAGSAPRIGSGAVTPDAAAARVGLTGRHLDDSSKIDQANLKGASSPAAQDKGVFGSMKQAVADQKQKVRDLVNTSESDAVDHLDRARNCQGLGCSIPHYFAAAEDATFSASGNLLLGDPKTVHQAEFGAAAGVAVVGVAVAAAPGALAAAGMTGVAEATEGTAAARTGRLAYQAYKARSVVDNAAAAANGSAVGIGFTALSVIPAEQQMAMVGKFVDLKKMKEAGNFLVDSVNEAAGF